MSNFFEELESRTFLSVTAATLSADLAHIVADGTAANAALSTLFAQNKTDTTAIIADLKSLPKTNAPLLARLIADESKIHGPLTSDLNLLLKPADTLAKAAVATGDSLIANATVKTAALAATEIAALGTVTNAPSATLSAALHHNGIGSDLQALLDANPNATQLATDVAKTMADASTQTTALRTASTQLTTDLSTLAADLSSVKTTFGTLPHMIGSFTGSSVATKGHNVGQVTPLAINITSENAIGNLAGTLTTKDGTFPLTGTITLNGTFAGKLFNPKNGTITLAGHFNASTLSGTYISSKDSGTFNVVETP